jgi:hypothetical protein
MGRMTRAKAAEVAERLHVDEDAVLDLSLSDINSATPETAEREVLGNIAPNSAERKGPIDLSPRKTRGKKKGRKAAEPEPEPVVEAESETEQEQDSEVNIYVDSETETQEEQDEKMNPEDEAADEALEATTNETMERLAKLRITSLASQAPAVSEVEQDSSVAGIAEATETTAETSENTELEQATTSTAASPTKEAADELPTISIAIPQQQQDLEGSVLDDQTAPEAPSSPLATAMPKVIKSLRTDTPGKRSTSNKENVEPTEPIETAPAASTFVSPDVQPSSPLQQTPLDAPITQSAASPSATPISNDKAEDPIEVQDNLDEVVEETKPEILEASPTSPKKTEASKSAGEAEKPKKAKAAPVVRLTKAAAARLSMAQGTNKDASKAPTSTRPRPSIMPARAGNVRQSVVPAAASSKRIPPTASSAKAPATKTSPRAKKETTIPHSKPRPVSLSFPTPPPTAKSSKPPTKSTFQLPGEAVAAKLKAAREERAKREATAASTKDEKKPAFKARPVPITLKKTPSVRHTAASRARDPAKAGEVAAKPTTSTTTSTGHKRSNTISTSKPRPSTVPSSSTNKPPAPSTLTVQKRARPSSMFVSSTTASAATSAAAAAAAPRNPSISSSSGATSRPSTARITSGASSKGKEVYARFGAARDAAENEKREKEEAARKARAAAAEKGRAASREWAEKQRVKKMVAKVEGQVAEA